MKLASYVAGGKARFGVVSCGGVMTLSKLCLIATRLPPAIGVNPARRHESLVGTTNVEKSNGQFEHHQDR